MGAAALGCSSSTSYFPSDPGLTWTYSVRTGFGAEHVDDVRIARSISVANAEGFELAGALGTCRLAWRDGVLWAGSFGNANAAPALPWLAVDRRSLEWKGELRTAFGIEKATARLTHKVEKLTLGSRRYDAIRADLELDRPSGVTTVVTWFAQDVGIIRQEQRSRGALDLRIEWISGPKASKTKD